MGDRNQVRDRTLVLRVLVPSLEARLREKMKEAEDAASRKTAPSSNNNEPKDILSDLEGVSCEPTKGGSTLWNFRCDGATYPARLVNLPCPVEVHKTHDHAMYYKCVDVAQMLIVYEDEMALEEAEAGPKSEGFPSYYHSGITPPMKRVVERRFEAREHKAVAPPRTEVAEVEYEIQQLIERIASKEVKKKSKAPSTMTAKVVEDVVEDVVNYEPWMDDYGRQPSGIEFDDKDPLCTRHPELWLEPEELAQITAAEKEKEKEDAAVAAAVAAAAGIKKKKKEGGKKKKKKEKEDAMGPTTKKGIPSKKNVEAVDEVTQAATQMSHIDAEDILWDELPDDEYFKFDDDEAFADLEGF